MAGPGLESGQIRDIDEARIFAEAEIPERERARDLRALARGIETHQKDHEHAAALREAADRADENAVTAGNLTQQNFEERVSHRLRSWTKAVIDVSHTDTPTRRLITPTAGEDSSVTNNTALRRLSHILRLGEPEPIKDTIPPDEANQIFIATSQRQSPVFGVEILEGVRRPADHPRSRRLEQSAIYVRKLTPNASKPNR